ncbi:Putative uncharacterized protein FLJ37770 [Eumeta japonica]|uniref:Histone-lysine N-methyltransferase SETMAR n=1 Tax=Eumeta variegata TaxID=151549 RepID=A0A4C1VAG9_EUMVA|nr:Putative uncharacterized protein FLJ37770 [Eumeta japonica]
MVSVLQESAPSYTMVEKWDRLFQQGRESCGDDPRAGRPVTIAEELQISKERVGEIIHEHMNMRKISARWVPKMLTPFDKQRRLQTRVHAMDEKKRKAAEEIQRFKVGIDNFWDNEGVLLIDYLQRDYYEWPILREFIGSGTRAVVQKRRGKLSR